MNSPICLYNSKILISSFDSYDAYLIGYKVVNFTDHCFKEVIRLKLPLKSLFKAKQIFLNTVECHTLHLNSVLVIVFGQSGDIDIFMYNDVLHGNLFRLKYIEQSSNITTLNPALFLTHGPTILTQFGREIELHPLILKSSYILNFHFMFPANHIKILLFKAIGQISNQSVYLLIMSGELSNEESICSLAIGVPKEQDNSEVAYYKLANHIFFPKFLNNYVQIIDVSNLLINVKDINDLNCIKWNDNHSVVCTKSECFICVKGEIIFAVNLPFQNVAFIHSELYLSLLDNSYLILLSESNEVAFFKPMEGSHELQLKKSWINIQNFLTGDIILNASKQLLLFKSVDIHSWQQDYILTDISSFMPVDILDQPSLPDKCLKTTLSALHAKYQVGKLAVAQKEFEIDEKEKATLLALSKLNDTAHEHLEENILTFQDSLINIILCNDENKRTEMYKRKFKQSLKIIDHWIKFLNNCWYICWTFQNIEDCTICFPVLKLVLENQNIQTTEKVFIHSSSSFSLEDTSVQQIKTMETFSVVSKLENVSCFDGKIEVNAILSWFGGSSTEFENELFLTLKDKCLVQNQFSLKTSLNPNDIFSKINQGITTVEELFCMKLLLQKMVFKILSLFSNLHDMEKRLLENKSQQLVLFSNSSQKVFAFKSESSPLLGTNFRLEILGKAEAEMEIFVKNDQDLLLALKFLQECLPKDIMFLPFGKTLKELTQLKQNFVCAMKEETDLLVSALNAHNISAQIKDFSEAEIHAGTFVIPGKTFLRIRKALVKKESITDLILTSILCSEI